VFFNAQTQTPTPAWTCLVRGKFDVNSLADETIEVEVDQMNRPLLDDLSKLHNDLMRSIQGLELFRRVNND
jgi:hypothetical protein